MGTPPAARVAGLYRYPVKGLSPEALSRVSLAVDECLPFDRMYAIENGGGRFDPVHPKYLPKIHFLMLMRDERLATLTTRFDEATHTLVIERAGRQVARGKLDTSIGRTMIEQFLAAYMKAELRGAPHIVSAPGHSFSDVAAKRVHIVNLASLRELERHVGRPVHPLRFRANVYIDDAEPWSELGWVGRTLAIGDVRLEITNRTVRCDATNVDPQNGARDMAIPAELQRTWGHSDFGIYARVAASGEVAVGAEVALV